MATCWCQCSSTPSLLKSLASNNNPHGVCHAHSLCFFQLAIILFPSSGLFFQKFSNVRSACTVSVNAIKNQGCILRGRPGLRSSELK